MARNNENSDQFPIWKPQRILNEIIKDYFFMPHFRDEKDKKRAYKALRNTSSSFIANKNVRRIIFERDGYKCKYCKNEDNLQIDHINSVYSCFILKFPLESLNTEGNLQTLCASCNNSKNCL